MASSYQKVLILGNLGKDPEVKHTPSGTAIARFSVATSSRYKDNGGDWQEKTEWHNIVAFGRLAEVAGEYLAKGKSVFIEGELQTSSWEDKETGQTKYRTEIVVKELKFVGSKEGNGQSDSRQNQASRGNSRGQNKPAPRRSNNPEITDDDIGF